MMEPFYPWNWRDPILVGGYDRPDPDDSDRTEPGRTERDCGQLDLVGYEVAATDGNVGEIDEASYETGAGWLVVDTGPWIFGRKVLLPAGTVDNVDHAERKVYVDRTKDQIKHSPEYDERTFGTDDYRRQVGDY